MVGKHKKRLGNLVGQGWDFAMQGKLREVIGDV
jgi:hypothetical protein